MSEIDYSKVGLKSGLEIHQQLDTKKLFCNCPSVLRKDEPDYEISRRLHVVAGESGEIDVAAAHEAEKNLEFVYQGYNDNTCLVELDEEPPHKINQNALKIVLQIATLLNCRILPFSQIMRKTVIDGSNTSGFQRTMLIGLNGYVETSAGKIGIASVALEEDAARIVERKDGKAVFRLDRLGIPLVEIATDPDLKTPDEIKEAALKIGNILRSLKIKRGIGTIRQDVNVSIKNGVRTEIKGFQDPAIMIKTIDKEIERQTDLISKKKKIDATVRKALLSGESEFLRPLPGAARMYPETDLPLLKIYKDSINKAKKEMPKLRDEIENELKKEGLSQEMIGVLLKQELVSKFKELLKILNKPQLVAKMLLVFPKDIAKRKNKLLKFVERKLEEHYEVILNNVVGKKISEFDIKTVMENLVDGKSIGDAMKIEKVDVSDIEEKIMKIIKEKPGLSSNAYMGVVMKEFKGQVDGKEIMEIINKLIK